MEAILGLGWIICSIVMAVKWYNKSEKHAMRLGSAIRRLVFSIWDWCLYLLLSMLIMAIVFILLLNVIFAWGQMIGAICIVVGAVFITWKTRRKK